MSLIEEDSVSRLKSQTGRIETKITDQNNLEVNASMRYKSEDESEHETDQYGYTQTELQPIMKLRNLSEEEIAEVKKFVQNTMAEETIHATRRKSLTEKIREEIPV